MTSTSKNGDRADSRSRPRSHSCWPWRLRLRRSDENAGAGRRRRFASPSSRPGLANTYVPAQVQGVKDAAERTGASITVFDAVFDSSRQLTQVQDAITSKRFDAFVIAAVDGKALVPQIENAIAAGIRVACISAPCGPDLTSLEPQVEGLTVHVGHSFVTSGRQIGEQIVPACASRNPCRAVYLPGLFSYPADRIRTDALHTTLRRHPAIEIVAEQEGKYAAETARAALQNICRHTETSTSSQRPAIRWRSGWSRRSRQLASRAR